MPRFQERAGHLPGADHGVPSLAAHREVLPARCASLASPWPGLPARSRARFGPGPAMRSAFANHGRSGILPRSGTGWKRRATSRASWWQEVVCEAWRAWCRRAVRRKAAVAGPRSTSLFPQGGTRAHGQRLAGERLDNGFPFAPTGSFHAQSVPQGGNSGLLGLLSLRHDRVSTRRRRH